MIDDRCRRHYMYTVYGVMDGDGDDDDDDHMMIMMMMIMWDDGMFGHRAKNSYDNILKIAARRFTRGMAQALFNVDRCFGTYIQV